MTPFVILLISLLLLKTLSIILDIFYVDLILGDFVMLTLVTIFLNLIKLTINPWLINLFLLVVFTLWSTKKTSKPFSFKRYWDFIVILIISLVIILIQYRYFDGIDLNLFPAIKDNFSTALNAFYNNQMPTNYIFSVIFTSLIQPNYISSLEMINTYCFMFNLSFYFTISALISKIYQLNHSNFTTAALSLSIVYLISPAGLVYNYLDLIWLLIPTTLLSLNNNDRHYLIYIYISFSVLLSPRATIYILIFKMIKHLLEKGKIAIGVILTLLILLVSLNGSTYGIFPVDLIVASQSGEMLPMFYINRKTIIISIGFIFMYILNCLSRNNTTNKLVINYSKLSFLTVVILVFLTGNNLMFTCILYVFLNPAEFVEKFNRLSNSLVTQFININNVFLCSIILFMWVISHAFSFNPYRITDRDPNNIYLDRATVKMYRFIFENYGQDVLINTNLASSQCYFTNFDSTNMQPKLILIKNEDVNLNIYNYKSIVTIDNLTLYKYCN